MPLSIFRCPQLFVKWLSIVGFLKSVSKQGLHTVIFWFCLKSHLIQMSPLPALPFFMLLSYWRNQVCCLIECLMCYIYLFSSLLCFICSSILHVWCGILKAWWDPYLITRTLKRCYLYFLLLHIRVIEDLVIPGLVILTLVTGFR